LFLAGVLSAGLGTHAFAEENEKGHEHQPVTMEELPAPVKATFEREAKGGKIEELRKETRKNGKVIYEAEIIKNGKGREIEVNAEGKVVERGKAHDESSEKHEK
jgi:uncharacterized membrane protein YkoI